MEMRGCMCVYMDILFKKNIFQFIIHGVFTNSLSEPGSQ